MHRKLVIVGSGPAGLAAAIYAARADLSPLVLRGEQWGGLIATTTEVENYPGFAEPIGGFDLSQQMEVQAERFGAEFLDDLASSVDLSSRPFTLATASSGRITADTLILATGAAPRKLGVPGEEALANRGVSYCATCDGAYFRGKRVVVVGGGNSALDEGMFLTRYASEIILVHRRDTLRAELPLQRRAFAYPNVRFVWNSEVAEILGEERVTGVRLVNLLTRAETTLLADGVFPYIGHVPNTDLVRGQLELDRHGFIVADGRTRTSVPGVFAAGDVADPRYRQAATSAGDGVKAALEATHFLDAPETNEASAAHTASVSRPHDVDQVV